MSQEIIKKILNKSFSDETEIFYYQRVNELTRFSSNEITQNVSSENEFADIRTISNKRTISTSINDFSDTSIERAYGNLKKLINQQPEDDRLLPLQGPGNIKADKNMETLLQQLTPEKKALYVKQIVDKLEDNGIWSAGIVSNTKNRGILANSGGFYGEQVNSNFRFSLSAKKNDKVTREEFSDFDEKNFNADQITEKIITNFKLMEKQQRVNAGKYDVILTPEAFATFIMFFLFFPFSAKSYMEKRTFLINSLGKKEFPDFFTLYDDPLNNGNPIAAFDNEGTPCSRTQLVENGVCKSLLSNRYLSQKLNIPNTGNALSIPAQDVFPFYPKITRGNKSMEEMIRSTEKGLFINRFHYLNIIDPMSISVTGMTRDGVFFIDNGEIVSSTNNLRFTESIITALKNMVELSNSVQNIPFMGRGFIELPAVKIRDFNFTSTTDF